MRSVARRFAILVRMAWSADPGDFVRATLYSIVARVTPFLTAVLVKELFQAARAGDLPRSTVYAACTGISVGCVFVAARAFSRFGAPLAEKSIQRYDEEILRLATTSHGIEHFENPRFLDRLEQLGTDPFRLGGHGSLVTQIPWMILEALVIVALLATVSPELAILPAVAICSLWFERRGQRVLYAAFAASAEARRVSNDFFAAATSPQHADEIRALQIGGEVVRRHDEWWAEADACVRRAERTNAMFGIVGALLMTSAYGGALAFVAHRAIRGEMSVDQVVLVIFVAGFLYQQLTVLLHLTTNIASALAAARDFVWLLDFHAQHSRFVTDPERVPPRLRRGIRLDDVSFSYPDTERVVIDGCSLDMPAGAIVAVVGENGAGKTTLVKVLTGMYAPTTGSILVDDADLSRLELDEWRRRCSAAFQDSARFELILQESVGIGELALVGDPVAVGIALERAGSRGLLGDLELGLATPLGASLDGGVQLSGGQWQKVALGRAMMRQPLLLVLDEPTANLDPDSEHQLFDRYSAQARRVGADAGTVTVLVSHRFATVRMADLIVVLADGRIVERGNHADLMALGGTYAELYRIQAAGYQD